MTFRLIHTSDWHLGQHFFGKSRAPEHAAFLQWLLQQVDAHQVDAVIVAGDVFDTGAPPSYARELYNRFIVDLQRLGATLVVLGGNHDSVATLNESRELLACLNTQVIPGVLADPAEQVLTLHNRAGQAAAVLCAVPFLRPRDVMTSEAGQTGSDKQQALQQAIARHYADLFARAQQLQASVSEPVPIIATGHLTTVGASTTESVRDIYIGTLDAFPASAFPAADYIALGHIHKAQKVGGAEHIRYSGSPLALSFDEHGRDKSVLLVDFKNGRLEQVESLSVPCFQSMEVLRGSLREIEAALEAYRTMPLDGPPVWLDIEVSSQDYLNDLQRRIQALTEELPVEVLLLRRARTGQQAALFGEARETLSELSIQDVFERRLEQETWETDEEQQRVARLRQSFYQVVAELEAGEQESDSQS